MRLTGIDIAPVRHTTAMPAMDMGHAHHAMTGAMAAHPHAPMPHTGHDHAEGCPLCPLLHLPTLALAMAPFLPLPPWPGRMHAMSHASPVRPHRPAGLPPSRGPPSVS
ncbi:DUF2946 domain-containing protein [Komagataeibacter rhaeticus]|nr:DUF2946 domain-containing protein [Komagataeibacter rhaeticus]